MDIKNNGSKISLNVSRQSLQSISLDQQENQSDLSYSDVNDSFITNGSDDIDPIDSGKLDQLNLSQLLENDNNEEDNPIQEDDGLPGQNNNADLNFSWPDFNWPNINMPNISQNIKLLFGATQIDQPANLLKKWILEKQNKDRIQKYSTKVTENFSNIKKFIDSQDYNGNEHLKGEVQGIITQCCDVKESNNGAGVEYNAPLIKTGLGGLLAKLNEKKELLKKEVSDHSTRVKELTKRVNNKSEEWTVEKVEEAKKLRIELKTKLNETNNIIEKYNKKRKLIKDLINNQAVKNHQNFQIRLKTGISRASGVGNGLPGFNTPIYKDDNVKMSAQVALHYFFERLDEKKLDAFINEAVVPYVVDKLSCNTPEGRQNIIQTINSFNFVPQLMEFIKEHRKNLLGQQDGGNAHIKISPGETAKRLLDNVNTALNRKENGQPVYEKLEILNAENKEPNELVKLFINRFVIGFFGADNTHQDACNQTGFYSGTISGKGYQHEDNNKSIMSENIPEELQGVFRKKEINESVLSGASRGIFNNELTIGVTDRFIKRDEPVNSMNNEINQHLILSQLGDEQQSQINSDNSSALNSNTSNEQQSQINLDGSLALNANINNDNVFGSSNVGGNNNLDANQNSELVVSVEFEYKGITKNYNFDKRQFLESSVMEELGEGYTEADLNNKIIAELECKHAVNKNMTAWETNVLESEVANIVNLLNRDLQANSYDLIVLPIIKKLKARNEQIEGNDDDNKS